MSQHITEADWERYAYEWAADLAAAEAKVRQVEEPDYAAIRDAVWTGDEDA